MNDDLEWLRTAPAFAVPVLQAVPVPDGDEFLADRPYLVSSSTVTPGVRTKACTCRCTCGAGIDPDELERANADVLNLMFGVADSIGRGPSSEGTGHPARPRSSEPRPQYWFREAFNEPFRRMDFLVGRHEATGRAYHVWMYGFDFDHGNGHFFAPDDTSRIRLRPLVGTDRMNPRKALRTSTGWFGGDVNALLWVDRPDGDGVTAFLVGLLPRGDHKDPATVARAVEYARREYGAAYPAAVALLP